jgi:hypothetical protein
MRGRDGCGGPLCASPALLCRVSATAEGRGVEHPERLGSCVR